MKLSILERITLMGILPQEASYANHKVISTLRLDLSFSEKEIKDCKIVETQREGAFTFTWDDKKDPKKDVPIGEKAQDIISDALKALDKEKKITSQNVSLYEKFVLGK